MATPPISPRTTSPPRAAFRRRSTRASTSAILRLAVADGRVQRRVGEVDEEVDADVAECAHEDDALDERVVLVEDGGDGEAAHPLAREDRLHHDRAREQVAELDADDRC